MLLADDFLVYNDSLHLRGVSRQYNPHLNEYFDVETKANQEYQDTTMQGYHHQSSNHSSSNTSQPNQYMTTGGVQGQANWGQPPAPVQMQQMQSQPSFSDLMRELSHEQSVALHEAARRAPPVSRSGTPLQSTFSGSPAAIRPGPGGRTSSPNLPDSHNRSSSSPGSTGWQQVQSSAPDEASFEMFPCEYCQASFSRRHDLERHRRGHNGETPYVCEGCGAGFVRVDGRGRHWKLQPQCEKLHFQRGGGGKRRTVRSDSAGAEEGGSAQRAS